MKKRILWLFLLLIMLIGCNNTESTTTIETNQETTQTIDTVSEVELRVNEDILQWRYVGDDTWTDLFNLNALEGKGIAQAVINDLGELVITYSDDTTSNLGDFNKLNLVQFIDALGNIISVQLVMDGEAAIEPTPPLIEGHYFAGWDKPFDNITEDLIVYGYYTAEYYSITFDSQGGSDVGIFGWDYGEVVDYLPVPERLGYIFLGWYLGLDVNSQKIETGFLINQDMTLFAKWQKTTAINVSTEEELITALADYSYQEIYFANDITVNQELVINADRDILIFGNHYQLIAKDCLSLFQIIGEYYYDFMDIQLPNFGSLQIYDLNIISDNEIYGFTSDNFFDLAGLNNYSLSLNNISIIGEAEMAISIYETQNLSVILSDSSLDVNEFGIDIYLNSFVSVIVENSTISAFKPLDFVDTTYSKLFVKDSIIITKTFDDVSEAFSTFNGSFNDVSFINKVVKNLS